VVSKPIRCALYLRVSTRDQRLTQQFKELRASVEARGWVIVAVYRERKSAAAGVDRPRWRALQRDAAARKFSAVAASSLDRLGRSALDILGAVEAFRKRGLLLFLQREGFATDEPTGLLMLTILAGVAQLERDVISDRTKQGQRGARARGSVIGRPTARVPLLDLERLVRGEISQRQLARELRISVATLRRRQRSKTPLQSTG